MMEVAKHVMYVKEKPFFTECEIGECINGGKVFLYIHSITTYPGETVANFKYEYLRIIISIVLPLPVTLFTFFLPYGSSNLMLKTVAGIHRF